MKFNINKKTDLTFYLGKICHYFRIVECLTSHLIDSGFIKACSQKNSNHGLRISSLLVSLYFFSSKNAILILSASLYNKASNSATVIPNCWLATSEVKRPLWTKFANMAKLPSTFPRSSPCSTPSARPCSRPSALAVSKA